MSASDHLQHEQLRMFIPGHELRGYSPNPYDVEREVLSHEEAEGSPPKGDWTDFMWNVKTEEADEWGLTADIREHGVHTPIEIVHGYGPHWEHALHTGKEQTIANGLHRVAAVVDDDSNRLVPVRHWEGKEFLRAVRTEE